jgi:hypothetical protein
VEINRGDIYEITQSIKAIAKAFTSGAKSLHEIAIVMSPDYKSLYEFERKRSVDELLKKSAESKRQKELETSGNNSN